MLLLLDTKVCNLSSWINILKNLECKFIIAENSDFKHEQVDRIIFPGVGNFEEVTKYLEKKKLDLTLKKIIKNKIPYLGVCLGMQILLEKSAESPNFNGLNLIKGNVKKIKSEKITCPHNGWNNFVTKKESKLFNKIKEDEDFYFNHSYYCDIDDTNLVTKRLADDEEIVVSFQKENIFGVQFHPEKSHEGGIKLIKNFLSLQC
tara:strand:+ start:196 stop:807 length:612 start_codon:yes stop_codon:yes gene_type:complete